MYCKGRKTGTIRFALRPTQGASTVTVTGDFNGWKLLAMKKSKDGGFVRHVPVSHQTFEYKFVVDGQWIMDPDHSRWTANCYGTFNSVGQYRQLSADLPDKQSRNINSDQKGSV